MKRRRPLVWSLVVTFLAVVVWLAATRGLYFYPTTVALGPCLPDWTNVDTYAGEALSPMASVPFSAGSVNGLVCYGRPSARDRLIFGARPDSLGRTPLVPDGALWRLGANEPTRLFIDGPLRFGELELAAGRYSLYARPEAGNWQLFVTTSTFHWGNQISEGVRAREIGSILVPAYTTGSYVEQFTISVSQAPGDIPYMVFEWADHQVLVPIQPIQDTNEESTQ